MKKYVIIPFFGQLPPYFNLFLDGCARNPKVDFLFFTDQPASSIPSSLNNFKVINTTLQQLKSNFEKKLHHQISLESPYKLCDFKPAYAFLFEELINDYDYWGFGDIDLIYGNLEGYLKKNERQEYSVISFREKWVSGSLAFFKNKPNINTLFMKADVWGMVATSQSHFSFGEVLKRWEEYQNADSIEKVTPTDDSFTSLVFRELKGERILFNRTVKEWIAPDEVLEVNRAPSKTPSSRRIGI